jgi:hypothetical protein
MSQRQDPVDESEDKGLTLIDGFYAVDSPRMFKPPLKRTITIKKDLDRHLLMLNVIETTHKTELRRLEKKK